MGEPDYFAAIGELLRGATPIIVSSINLGELHYTMARRQGFAVADRLWEFFCTRAQVEAPTLELTRDAAKLVVTSRIPWADAPAAATAIAHNGVVWAGDEHLNKPGPWKRRDIRKLDVAQQDQPRR